MGGKENVMSGRRIPGSGKSTPAQWGMRILLYVLGLLFLAFGVAVSANSNLGISPVNSLPYVISGILKTDPGTCVTVVFCVYIAVQIAILRREFKPINLCQIIFSTIFGYFVNFTKALLGDFTIPGGYPGRLAMLAISIVLVAIGVILTVDVRLVPMPTEGMTLTIANKLKKPFPKVKIVVDCMFVVTGVLLSFLFLGRLDYIREGTVIAAVVTGKVVAIFRRPIDPVLSRLCFGGGRTGE